MMIIAPRIHRKQPTLPTKLRRSLRKMLLPIAAITTLNAPKGVTKIASVKAYATKLHISPIDCLVFCGNFHQLPYPESLVSYRSTNNYESSVLNTH